MAPVDDYYGLLGVGHQATDDEIKKAYRKLARELHPDQNPDNKESEERFKQVSIAYETLRDPERRRRYDMFGPEGAKAAGGGGDPFDFFSGGTVNGFGDMFEAFFGGSPFGGAAGGPPGGNDMEMVVDIDLREVVFGSERELSLKLPVPCTTCNATGAATGSEPETCPTCQGAGQVQRVRQSLLGQMVSSSVCPQCSGVGTVVSRPCPDCRGEGRKTEERTHTLSVPAGIDNGQTLRLHGLGAAGPHGGPPGDLYVHVRVSTDDRFVREQNNLRTQLHVSIAQAALGTTAPLDTLDGEQLIAVPPGTQSGHVVTLKHLGIGRLQGRGRGDLHVEVVVDTPTDLTVQQADLLKQLAELRGESVEEHDPGLFSKIKSAFS